MSEQDLLKDRRFAPLFWTQFLGAFNDNFFKNALIILITFQVATNKPDQSAMLVAICGGIFILPFFLFSALAGQIADKYEKAFLIRIIKIAEIFIMSMAATGFWTQNHWFLIFTLFCMGLQSTFFGPLKYGILPQHLKENELMGANGLVEMGTFLAILLGTVFGGILIAMEPVGPKIVGMGLLVFAFLGWLTSRAIPVAESQTPQLQINWNLFSETWRIFKFTRQNRTVFNSVLGIAWFWFFGATILTLIPVFGRDVVGGDQSIVTLFLTVFSIGIGIGSVLCEKMSGEKVELGLVPFGSFGLSFFTILLFCVSFSVSPDPNGLIGLREYFQSLPNWLVLFSMFFLALFGGFYIVPLYALIQQRGEKSHMARIIAGLNIMDALFMVFSAVLMTALFRFGFETPGVYLILALLNIGVAVYIYKLIPEFLLRFIVWILVHSIYRLRTEGLENLPQEGPAVLVCNHITFVDGLIISAASKRMVRFVVHYTFAKMPIIRYFFNKGKAIPIAGFKEDPEILEKSFDVISQRLEEGDLVCIFPEGHLTMDGEIHPFRSGIERIIQRNPVPVVPMALQGLWGSFFSRKSGHAMRHMPRWGFWKIALKISNPIPPNEATAEKLEKIVRELRGDKA